MSRTLLPSDRPRPWIMAHRGASDHAPENGLTAFGLAIDHGADVIETDLWFTADGVLVCHHDETLDRMCGDRRRVGDCTLAQLRELRLAGRTEERVPTLAELLALLPAEMPVILELKDPAFDRPEAIRRLAETLGERVARQRAGVITTRRRTLRRFHDLVPDLVTGHIAMADPWGHRHAALLGPYWPILLANPWYVRRAHRRGQLVCPLDPGLHRRLARYLALEVDAVLTNDPKATRQRIEALRART